MTIILGLKFVGKSQSDHEQGPTDELSADSTPPRGPWGLGATIGFGLLVRPSLVTRRPDGLRGDRRLVLVADEVVGDLYRQYETEDQHQTGADRFHHRVHSISPTGPPWQA